MLGRGAGTAIMVYLGNMAHDLGGYEFFGEAGLMKKRKRDEPLLVNPLNVLASPQGVEPWLPA